MKLAFALLLATAAFAAQSNVTQKIVPPSAQKQSDKIPTREEMAKIMHAFREREPLFLAFGRAFPGTKADFEFEDRKARLVRISTSAEADDGRYVVMLFYSVRLNSELSEVQDHRCLLFGAQYVPPDITHINQVGPMVKFPTSDLSLFCSDPVTYLRQHVPPSKKG